MERCIWGILLLAFIFVLSFFLVQLTCDKEPDIRYGRRVPARTIDIPPLKRGKNGKIKIYDPQIVATEVLLVLERYKISVSPLDMVLNDIHNVVMQQPVTAGMTIGLSLPEYEERGKVLLQELEAHRKLFPDEFSS